MFVSDSCRDIPFFVSEVSRVFEKLSAYQKHRRALFCEAADRIVREERSSGGDCLRQGYYHPSIIADIVVGGVKRGKLLKRITARSKPNFRYGFDADDRLIYTESPYNREIIIHEGQMDIGLSFDKADNVAEGYSEALYDYKPTQSLPQRMCRSIRSPEERSRNAGGRNIPTQRIK